MAFDRADPVDLQALYDERTNDPLSMAYPANDNQFIRLINDGEDNVGGETAARPFTVDAMLEALDPGDLATGQEATYTQLLADVGGDLEAYKVKWRGMFQANSNTVTALDAQTRPLSRGEVLFGEGTQLVADDWIAARRFVEGD